MALEWKEKYKIGDSQVDAQHQEWFQLAKRFLMACGEQSFGESGEAFFQYTRRHFIHEESSMHERQYPFAAAHAKEHEKLLSTLTKILSIGRSVLSKEELDDFVNYCLVEHITRHDAPLARYEEGELV